MIDGAFPIELFAAVLTALYIVKLAADLALLQRESTAQPLAEKRCLLNQRVVARG